MSTTTTPDTYRTPAGRRPRRAAGLLAAVAIAALVAPMSQATADPGRDERPGGDGEPAVRQSLTALVDEHGFPAALASVRGSDGRVHDYTAGVRNLDTGRRAPLDGRVRVGSNTKTFTAVVVLQLAQEGHLDLDESVEHYLPGVVRGSGTDAEAITVRQLLQQTSGLPDYDEVLFTRPEDLLTTLHRYAEPYELVDAALTRPASFAPGERWEYSNTNYVLAGLVAQRVTGRPIAEEITERVIEPLRLRDTYWPPEGQQEIRGRHPSGYLRFDPAEPYVDVTEMDPSFGWAAGQLVSSPDDLRRFMEALLAGELLTPDLMRQMTTTVPAPGFEVTDGWEYGLGIARRELECGVVAWGHGGDIQGFQTRNLVTDDGRGAVVAVTALPVTEPAAVAVTTAVEDALCP
jgi:D-alanyl-D-alanine carboxypeptidase